MLNFIPCLIRICYISFLVFSVYAKFQSLYSYYMLNLIPSIISIQTISFLVLSAYAKFCRNKALVRMLSVYAKFHSAYYQQT